jgi:hypothetical protein
MMISLILLGYVAVVVTLCVAIHHYAPLRNDLESDAGR